MYFVAIFILMAAGAIMFLIGLLGCCGALQESPCMLGTFFIFLLVIFAAEITGGVWAWMYKDEVNKIIEVQVTKMVKDEYGASKSVENTIDAVQHD
ncbi:CD9 antigen-like, partial [Stegodyphus dumicola]